MMPSIILTIFLEGDRDSILFNHKIKHELEAREYTVELVEYSQKDKKFVNEYLRTIEKFSDVKDYIFLADCDNKSIKKRKSELLSLYSRLDELKIVIINREIEGWYFGGLCQSDAQTFDIDKKKYDTINPNKITKGQFQKLKPNRFKKMRLFYISSAKLFDKLIARTRNKSFDEFYQIALTT